jgi:hypothetical protein
MKLSLLIKAQGGLNLKRKRNSIQKTGFNPQVFGIFAFISQVLNIFVTLGVDIGRAPFEITWDLFFTHRFGYLSNSVLISFSILHCQFTAYLFFQCGIYDTMLGSDFCRGMSGSTV